MPRVRVVERSAARPDVVLAAARDFSARRAELWRDVHLEHLTVHEQGATSAEVTEGNPYPWPFGIVWERLRYDWSKPGAVTATVVDSNLFEPGSTWELRASPVAGGGSEVEIVAVRRLKGRGLLLWPLFPLGLARRDVAVYLRAFLERVDGSDGSVS